MNTQKSSPFRVFTLIELLVVIIAVVNSVQLPASGQIWTITGPVASWRAGAFSTDGTQIYATYDIDDASSSSLYVSTNFGTNWITNTAPAGCNAIAALANGQLLAVTTEGGGIYTSINSGLTWLSNNAPTKGWSSIAGSSDGTRLIAGSSLVWTSTNSGSTWVTNNLPAVGWGSVASSADGTTLVAATQTYGYVYISTNSGAVWTNALYSESGSSVAVSADGTTIAAVHGADINVSTNFGAAWTSYSFPSEEPPLFAAAANSGRMVLALLYDIGGSYEAHTLISPNWGSPFYISSIPTLYASASSDFLVISADGTRWMTAGVDDAERLEVLLYPPSLNIAVVGGNLVISWPAPSSGWALQQNDSLNSSNWVTVTNSVLVKNYQKEAIITPPPEGNIFFRLALP